MRASNLLQLKHFYTLRLKSMRVSNLLQLKHQVTIEFRFRNPLAQEWFKAQLGI